MNTAQLLATSMAGGNGSARASFGGKSQAFSYLPGRLNSLAANVANAVSESRAFSAMTVDHTADVTAWTTGDKPITASITSASHQLSIFPGVVEVKTQDLLDSAGLGSAISVALYGQAVKALDAAIVTGLLAVPGGIAKAATLGEIANAQAQLMANGFDPSLVVVSAAMYGKLGTSAGVITAGADPQAPMQAALGSKLLVSSALTGDAAIVLDPSSVLCVEHDASPVALVDVKPRQNIVELVIELVAGFVVVQPAGVCAVKATT
jgi:hypothetical protein